MQVNNRSFARAMATSGKMFVARLSELEEQLESEGIAPHCARPQQCLMSMQAMSWRLECAPIWGHA